jgi:hypothetical protein
MEPPIHRHQCDEQRGALQFSVNLQRDALCYPAELHSPTGIYVLSKGASGPGGTSRRVAAKELVRQPALLKPYGCIDKRKKFRSKNGGQSSGPGGIFFERKMIYRAPELVVIVC